MTTTKIFCEMTVAEKIERTEEHLAKAKATGDTRAMRSYRRRLRRLREELREERQPVAAMVTMTGRIRKASDKAVQFFVDECHDMPMLVGRAEWWPKSQVEVTRGAMGPADVLIAPLWLAETKTGDTK